MFTEDLNLTLFDFIRQQNELSSPKLLSKEIDYQYLFDLLSINQNLDRFVYIVYHNNISITHDLYPSMIYHFNGNSSEPEETTFKQGLTSLSNPSFVLEFFFRFFDIKYNLHDHAISYIFWRSLVFEKAFPLSSQEILVETNFIGFFEFLLSPRDDQNQTIFHQLVREQSIIFLQTFIKYFPTSSSLLDASDNYGRSPLYYEMSRSDIEPSPSIINLLLVQGANPQTKDSKGISCIEAMEHVSIEYALGIKYLFFPALVDQNILLKIDSSTGNTILHITIDRGWYRLANALISHHSNGKELVNIINNKKETPLLMLSSYSLDLELIQTLIAFGAKINATNEYETSILDIISATFKLPKAISDCVLIAFVEAGVLNKPIDSLGNTPLHLMAIKRNMVLFQAILSHGGVNSLFLKNQEGKTPLLCLSPYDVTLELLTMLVSLHIDLLIKDDNNFSFLHLLGLHDFLSVEILRFALNNNLSTYINEVYLNCNVFHFFISGFDENIWNNQTKCEQIIIQKKELLLCLLSFGAKPLKSLPNPLAFLQLIMNSKNADLHSLAFEITLKDLPLNARGEIIEHYHSWSYMMDSSYTLPSMTLDLLKICKNRLSKAHLRHLIDYKDQNQRIIFNIVHEEVKSYLQELLFFHKRYEIQTLNGRPLHISPTSVILLAIDHYSGHIYQHIYENLTQKNSIKMNNDIFYEGIKTITSSLGLPMMSIDEIQEDWLQLHSNSNKKEELLSSIDFITWRDYCSRKFGSTNKVVIKFMAKEDQYRREIELRMDEDGKERSLEPYVLSIIESFVLNLPVEESPLQDIIKDNLWFQYRYGIVLPFAEHHLQNIYVSERPDLIHSKAILYDIASALAHCHKQGILHGDVKMLNIVRIRNKMHLIDLDCAAILDNPYGSKFSSGILPPEMIYSLASIEEERKYNEYWKEELNSELWLSKLQPMKISRGRRSKLSFVVKAIKVTNDGDIIRSDLLPYQQVVASSTIDIWAFGLLIYAIISGKSLFPVNRDDDLVDSETFLQLYSCTDDVIIKRIEETLIISEEAYLVKDLLKKILRINPKERIASFEDILNHPFFCGISNKPVDSHLIQSQLEVIREQQIQQINLLKSINHKMSRIEELTREIRDINDKMLLQIKRTERVLLRGMFEATEIQCPTCFIIVNQPLQQQNQNQVNEKNEFIYSQEIQSKSWVQKISSLGSNIGSVLTQASDLIDKGPKKILKEKIQELFVNETLWLYLIDEKTMEPVIPSSNSPSSAIYPIKITTPSKCLHQLLPLFKLSLKAMTLVNGVSGLVRCFGYPSPQIPSDVITSLNSAIGTLGKTSSIEEYNLLSDCLIDSKDANQNTTSKPIQSSSLRGEALREFSSFLSQYDPDCSYSGLKRVCTSEGWSCWTTEEGYECMQREAKQEEETEDLIDPSNSIILSTDKSIVASVASLSSLSKTQSIVKYSTN